MCQRHEIEWLSHMRLELCRMRAVVGNCQNIQGLGFQQAVLLVGVTSRLHQLRIFPVFDAAVSADAHRGR
jgi:hypothetical protein